MPETEQGPGEAEALRPEARPLPYDQLDDQQKAALVRAVGLLTTAAHAAQRSAPDREVPVAQTAPAGPYLESNQWSRNILIGGERGTGKTTLMLSLSRVLSPWPDTLLEDGVPSAVADQARRLRRRLVWLETLDMEPLASEANLLGAVLARIEDAVGARFPSLDRPPETVPLLYPGNSFHDTSREMARLQTSVALTFGGNLGDRAGSLDPDTFAVESRRAERERLGLDRRFAGVLAGLSAALGTTAVASAELTAPVFVLPVDDVDLNVSACVPLLRLLRAASSPHLIVMLAADVGLLSTILRLKYVGELAQISATAGLSPSDLSIAADLAVSALRKHLPPAQRVVLGLVEPGGALALKPLGPDTKSLGQMLGRVGLPADTVALVVAQDFSPSQSDVALPPMVTTTGWFAGSDDQPAQLAKRLGPFSWPEVLRQPMRRLVDLYMDSTVRAGEELRPGSLIHDVTDSPLIQFARTRLETLRSSVQRDGSEVKIDGWLDTLPDKPSGEALAVEGVSWHGWQATVGYAPLQTADAAVVVGCIDLLGDRWGEASPPQAFLAPVRATWWPGDNTTQGRWINWPWVTHSTFWGYERALAWLKEADEAWANQKDATFGSWVAVMTAQLFDAPGQTQPFDRPTQAFAHDWPSLAERLKTLDATPRGQAWLNAVGLLCTPEMGMTFSPETPPLLRPARARHVQRLRDQRKGRLPSALQELVMGQQTATAARSRRRPPQRPADKKS
jgi:hypothetical protein